MQCPKCGTENPDDTQVCQSCGYFFEKNTTQKPAPKAKISKMAIVSAVLAGLAAGLTFFLKPNLALLIALLGISSAITSIAEIRRTKKRLIGRGLAIAVIIFSTAQVLLLSYWRIDAAPIPDDYTISDIRSAAPEYNQSYELLNSLSDGNDLPVGASIGLSEEDINNLETINKIFKEDDYDKICAGLKSNKESILRIWKNAEKGREVINKLGAFPEIADLTEPDIEAEFPYLKNLRRLVLLHRAYICLQSYQGNEDTALMELLNLDNFVGKLNLNARSLLAKLVCIGCFTVNIETANFITNNTQTSQDSLVLMLNRFPPLTDEQLSMRNSRIFEYLVCKNELDKVLNESGVKYSSFSALKFNSSLRLCKNYCDRQILLEENRREIEELNVWPTIYPNLPVTLDPDCNFPWYYKAYNPIGSVLIAILLPAWDKVSETKTKLEIHSNLFQIVLRKRLGEEISLKARAYSDEYIIDTEKKLIFSPGPDGEPYTEDDIKLVINPEVLSLRSD